MPRCLGDVIRKGHVALADAFLLVDGGLSERLPPQGQSSPKLSRLPLALHPVQAVLAVIERSFSSLRNSRPYL